MIWVHGINQQERSEEGLREAWLACLSDGVTRIGGHMPSVDIAMPFYGKVLHEATQVRGQGVIAQGGDISAEEGFFIASAMTEVAAAAGFTPHLIEAEQRKQSHIIGSNVIDQAFPANRRVNAILRLIEKVSPMHGQVLMRMIRQAYAYLKIPGVAPKVDDIVRPLLEQGPAVIIGHSLGTVVTFKLLRELAAAGRPVSVPLYVTLGSPLSVMGVQAALGPDFLQPKHVLRWLNALDPDDLVTLGRPLTEQTFCAGIENIQDIKNVEGDPHAICGYIGDSRVASAIIEACRE
jgi:hypothetical protein